MNQEEILITTDILGVKGKFVARAEEFVEEIGDNSGMIYELNGIIEGVVCDGEVNETEVYRLKEWMDIYGDLSRGDKTSEIMVEHWINIAV